MTGDIDRDVELVRGIWARELYRCRTDFEYLSKTYLKIKSKQKIQTMNLVWNVVQRRLWDKIVDQKRRTGKVRQIWGKPRKIGATTLVRAMSSWLTFFHKGRKSLLVTHDQSSSEEVFLQDKMYYHSLPKQLQPPRDYDTRTKLSLCHLGSIATAGHARDPNVGVTQTYDFHHISEMARFENAETVMRDALFPTLSEAKVTDDNDWNCSVSIIESTSRYGGKFFKDLANDARAGRNEYEFTFIPAYLHDEYQLPVPPRFKPTVAERGIMKQHGLPLSHIVWRRHEQAKYSRNPALFRQNYPLTWEESWVLPSGTRRVISDDILGRLEDGLKPGNRMAVDDLGLHPAIGGPIEVWQQPVQGVFYDMGLDVASGRGSEGDKSVIEIVNRDTLEQVAEAILVLDPASREFEDLVYWMGMVYNGAQIVPDVTGGWGWNILSALQRRNYPSIWQPPRRYDAKGRTSDKIGFHYTRESKMQLVTNMVMLLGQHTPHVHSTYLFHEMMAFLEIEQAEWGPAPGSNDDAMNAYMLALMGSYDEVIMGRQGTSDDDTPDIWVPKSKRFDFDEELDALGTPERLGLGHSIWI